MAKRTRLLAPAMFAILVAASAWTARSALAQAAADECLSKPNGPSPQGSHWFYRVDRANNNRRCWYLGAQGAKARQAAAKPRPSAAASAPTIAENPAEAAEGQTLRMTDASPPASTLAKAAGATAPEQTSPSADTSASETTSKGDKGDMPLVRPALTPAAAPATERPAVSAPAEQAAALPVERAVKPAPAAETSAEPTVKPGHILAIAAGALMLVAIFFRTIYKFFAVGQPRHPRRGVRQQTRSADNARRTRKSLAPAAAGAAARHADPVRHAEATAHRTGVAESAGNAGLIDAVLQRVRSAEPSLVPAQPQARPARAGGRRRMAAFG